MKDSESSFETMTCEECGTEMNPHALKVVAPRNKEEAARVDPVLGGVLLEAHACPDCGCTASRMR